MTPPIGPAYLAASLRQAGHTARIVDGLGENPFQVTRLFDDKVMAIGLRSDATWAWSLRVAGGALLGRSLVNRSVRTLASEAGERIGTTAFEAATMAVP